MANTYAPFGFRSFGHRDDASPTLGLERKFVLSSDPNAIFTGDVVQNSTSGPGYVTQSTTGSVGAYGVFSGCEYYSPTVGRMVWSSFFPGSVSSSNPVIASIISDPQMQFLVQSSTTAIVGSSQVGQNVGYTSTGASGGNTLTGQSVVGLLSSSVSANSSLAFRIVDVYSNFAPPGVNGTDNASAGQILVVTPNNWDRRNLTSTPTST